ncbi:8807_t:CDS:2 [Entrophospora sp. SA101]|nr:8807_t:CDS:2 [Entrophospora sp. SA101]
MLIIGDPTGTTKTSTIKYVCKERIYHIVDWTEIKYGEDLVVRVPD